MSFRVLVSGYSKVNFQLMHENHFRTLNIPGTIAHVEARTIGLGYYLNLGYRTHQMMAN